MIPLWSALDVDPSLERAYTIVMAGSVLFILGTIVFLIQRARQQRRIGGGADTTPWDLWASACGHTANVTGDRASISGIHEGRPFMLKASVWVTHSEEGGEQRGSRSTMRVPHRASIPPSFLIHTPRGIGGTFFARLAGAPIVSTTPEVDAVAVTECRDAEAARALVADLELQQYLVRLMRILPEAEVHSRAIEVSLSSMITDIARLERALGLFAAIATRLEALAPPREQARPSLPTPGSGTMEVMSSADLGPRRDTMADILNRAMTRKALGGFHTAGRGEGSFPFEVKITRVGEIEDRLNAGQKLSLIEGELMRSSFRVAIQWDTSEAEAVAALEVGQIIVGEGHIDAVDIRRYRAEITADSPPLTMDL